MGALASTYFSSLNPIGWFSSTIFLALLTLAIFTRRASSLPPGEGRWIVAVLPALLLGISALIEGSPVCIWYHGHSFPRAEDYAVSYILLAFGFGFALQNFRLLDLGFRINGTIFTWLFGSVIVSEAIRTLLSLGDPLRPNMTLTSPDVLGVLAYTMVWGVLMWWLHSKYSELSDRRDGRCFACGYDLRGSRGRVSCPECGSKVSVS